MRADMGIDRSTASAHGSPMLRVDAVGVESARARLSDPAGSVGANLPISAQIGYSSSYHSDIVLPITQNPPPALPVNHPRDSLNHRRREAPRHGEEEEVKMILKEPHARAA